VVLKALKCSQSSTSTGATGYIGGDTLYALHNKHPEWTYTALVRTKEKGKKVQDTYPNVHLVYGDLDDYDVIKEQAAKADIVIRKSLD
jgi:N-acetyl-gamma-glutamylphosphate reductase